MRYPPIGLWARQQSILVPAIGATAVWGLDRAVSFRLNFIVWRSLEVLSEPGRVLRIVGTEDTLHRSLGDVSMRKDVTQRQQLVDDRIDALRHGELAGVETDLRVQGRLVGIIDTGEAHGFPIGQRCLAFEYIPLTSRTSQTSIGV